MPIALTVLINFTVNYLLLLACTRLCRCAPELLRLLPAAGVGTVHVWICFFPGGRLLGGMLFHMLTLLLMGMVAFGFGRQHLRQWATFFLLHLAFDGATGKGALAVICGILMLFLMFRKGKGQGETVPVSISYQGKQLALIALRDTGNRLRDPVSGDCVMVIGADAAKSLTGLTKEQLQKPLENLGSVSGLRLIPYKAVGSSGFLLGMKLPKVQIGAWKGSYIVAFAPEGLENRGSYQALVGGTV